ncbi:hypothetical protein B0H11DRAFT_2286990 [Mycena galericulata]|nr:hypothetical protein B0H11DRAFT_2286990 [Mycena galericulata]
MATANPNQLENAHAFLTYTNAHDFEAVAELLSPDFKHQYFPATISRSEGMADRGKEEFIERLKHTVTVFDTMTFQPPMDVVHGVDAVVFHHKADGVTKSGLKYNIEYMVTFHFAGEKIVKMNQFVDSKYYSEFLADLVAE